METLLTISASCDRFIIGCLVFFLVVVTSWPRPVSSLHPALLLLLAVNAMTFYRVLVFASALSWSPLAVRGQGQGNTTCKGTSLDWYTSVVGETPCTCCQCCHPQTYTFNTTHVGQTYQSLRRICAPNCKLIVSLDVNFPLTRHTRYHARFPHRSARYWVQRSRRQ